jgi:hypothetical protein
VIAAASVRNEAAARPSLRHGSIPVSVRTILVRKLLAAWEGKLVSLNFVSWNQTMGWIRAMDSLRQAA